MEKEGEILWPESPVSDSVDQVLELESTPDGLKLKKKLLGLIKRIKTSRKLSVDNDNEEKKEIPLETETEPSEDSVFKVPSHSSSLHVNDNLYDISKRKRGLAVFIINSYFKYQPFRPFAKTDQHYMIKLFKHLGFEIKLLDDRKGSDLWKDLIEIKKSLTTEYDCFICVISSHGAELPLSRHLDPDRKLRQHVIFTKDGEIPTDRLLEVFSDDKCPALMGKPRMFFIQACRCVMGADEEYDVDRGVDIDVMHTTVDNWDYPVIHTKRGHKSVSDGDKDDKVSILQKSYPSPTVPEGIEDSSKPDTKGRQEDEFPSRHKAEYFRSKEPVSYCFIPCYEDFLVMFSSASERIAWSDRGKGGWLLHCFYKVFKRLLDSNYEANLLDILVKVCGKMAKELNAETPSRSLYHETKATATIYHMLTKNIFLQPKIGETIPK